jgi:hypothetical protein
VLRDAGGGPDAERAFRVCLADRARIEGAEAQGTNQTRIDLGAMLRESGRRVEAERILYEAWQIAHRTRGAGDSDTLRAAKEYTLLLLDAARAPLVDRIDDPLREHLFLLRGHPPAGTAEKTDHRASTHVEANSDSRYQDGSVKHNPP